jgi:hypothetical protein
MNPPFLEKVVALEISLSRTHGAFVLFGVVLRESLLDLWDLVVSAPWLNPDKLDAYRLMTGALQAALTPEEFLQFSRVVILEEGNPFLESVLAMASREHGLRELRDMTVEGIPIRVAHIITAVQRPARKRQANRKHSPAR